jgi:hypothetical protein
MTSIARSTLWISVLSLSMSLGACASDDDDPVGPATASFAGRDDAHLHRAAFAAVGGDAFYLLLFGSSFTSDDTAACPAVRTTGAVTTVTGGCVTTDGVRLDGTLTLTNVDGVFTRNPAYDPSKPSTIVAAGWRDDGGDGFDAIDGTLTLTPSGAGMIRDLDLDATLKGLRAQIDATYDCAADNVCTFAAGSRLDVDGIGAADLSGTFRFDEPLTGTITLSGADQMIVDVATSTERCFKVAVAGAAARPACAAQ